MDDHDLVEIQASSSKIESLQWFLESIRDRIACVFAIEEIELNDE